MSFGTAFIVDDDEAIRDALTWLLQSRGVEAQAFASAEAFLAEWTPEMAGCLLLDIRMSGMSGLDLFDRLRDVQSRIPVIFLTGHGDVPMAVRAMRGGAIDFLQKPFDDQLLLDRIHEALQRSTRARKSAEEQNAVEARLARLTPREHDVLVLVVAGKANKQIAAELDISIKTVEVHRHNVMDKMETASLAELAALMAGRVSG